MKRHSQYSVRVFAATTRAPHRNGTFPGVASLHQVLPTTASYDATAVATTMGPRSGSTAATLAFNSHLQEQFRLMTSSTTLLNPVNDANPRGSGTLSSNALQKMLELLYKNNGKSTSPIDWGSRRPTEYPEWVTLEVAHGGFATGRAMASFKLDSERHAGVDVEGTTSTNINLVGSPPAPRTNLSYLNSQEGLEELLALLDSGNYTIDYPENGALLVLIHLLRQDKLQEVRQLLHTIAPYFNELRFYPMATTSGGEGSRQQQKRQQEDASIPLKFGLVNLTQTINKLSRITYVGLKDTFGTSTKGGKQPPYSPLCRRFARMKYQRDGCDVYEPIQSEAVQLLLLTATKTSKKSSSISRKKSFSSVPWHELPPQEADALLLTNTNDADLNLRIRTLISRYCAVNPQPSSIVVEAAFPDIVPSPLYVGSHVKFNTSTRVLVEALCLVINPPERNAHQKQSDTTSSSSLPNTTPIPNTNLSHIGNRLREVIKKRGVIGTPKHDDIYRKQLERSSNVMDHLEVFAEAAAAVLTVKDQQQENSGVGGITYLEEEEVEAGGYQSKKNHQKSDIHSKIIETAMEISFNRETSIAVKERRECKAEVPLTLSPQNASPNALQDLSKSITHRVRVPRKYFDPAIITATTTIPAQIKRSLSVATSRTLSGHILAKTIVSAEMIADAVPLIFNAAASNSITNPTLRRLYFNITNAFSRRRSLLLLNLQHQVRIGELPWMTTLLQEQKQQSESNNSSIASDITTTMTADASTTTTTPCDPPAVVETIKEASLAWFEAFPQTPITNKFISSVKSVSFQLDPNPTTQNSKIPVLVEELAVDIFEGRFSSSFYRSTLEAARCMQGSVYERYYNLGPIYEELLQIEQKSTKSQTATPVPKIDENFKDSNKESDVLISAARTAMKNWGVPHEQKEVTVDGVTNYHTDYYCCSYKEKSQLTESVMVLSTHNTAQLYFWLGGGALVGRIDNMVTAHKIWVEILRVFSAPPPHQRRGERAISNAWRQLLFFLSMEEISIKNQHRRPKKAAVAFQKKIDEFCDKMEEMLHMRPERKEGMPLDAKNVLLIRDKFISALRRCASEPNQPLSPLSSSQFPKQPSPSRTKKIQESGGTTTATQTTDSGRDTTASDDAEKVGATDDNVTVGWGAKYGDIILTYFGWKMFNP